MSTTNESKPTRGWDAYWQGARRADAFAAGGVTHPAVASFWDNVLGELLARDEAPRVLDLATGSGAVVERLMQNPAGPGCKVTCVDLSSAAIDNVCERFPDVRGVVADALDIPLDAGQFDLVTSQFGLEYAGPGAFDEAARLLAKNGSLVLLMHVKPGIIFDECAAALDAVQRTQRCRFVELSRQFLEAGFAAVRGADREAYDRAGSQLNPAIQELESILQQYGEHVAGDTIVRLYTDVQRFHSRIQHYEPKEVLSWLGTMNSELAAYEARMASMLDAAIDEAGFAELAHRFESLGIRVVESAPFSAGPGSPPVAWALRAIRTGKDNSV